MLSYIRYGLPALALMLVFHVKGFAQLQGTYRYWTLGVRGGTSNYIGDLAPEPSFMSTDFRTTGLSLGIDFTKKLSSRWSLRLDLSRNRISGSDFKSADPKKPNSLGRYLRNAHFRNDIYEFSGLAVFDFIPSNDPHKRPKWIPYAMAGLGFFYHNPMAKTPSSRYILQGNQPVVENIPGGGKWEALHLLRTEEVVYSTLQVSLPLGLGIRYAITNRWDIGLEFCYRVSFTDYLDDVSAGRYADLDGGTLRKLLANRSAEVADALTGADRNLLSILSENNLTLQNYTYGTGDQYTAVLAYSHNPESERRGDPSAKDYFFTASLKIGYILNLNSLRTSFR